MAAQQAYSDHSRGSKSYAPLRIVQIVATTVLLIAAAGLCIAELWVMGVASLILALVLAFLPL
jgi:hypothetical protein